MIPSLDGPSIVPAVRVLVAGSPLPSRAALDLLSVQVLLDLDAPGMFMLRLVNWDMFQLKVTWSDDPLFSIGNAVEIHMGYVDNLKQIMTGEITGLEPEFNTDRAPTVVVRGYDRRHRLLHGRKTRSFTQMKDSDIASRIAADQSLMAEATDSAVTLDYVLQHNQTDMEFLQERARRIGYEVLVEDKTLYFRPHQNARQGILTLDRTNDLIEFYPRLSAMAQTGGTSVRAWSPKDKATLVGRGTQGDLDSTMGGTATGPALAGRVFGSSVVASRVADPVLSQAEADQMARGQLKDRALEYITGEGVSIGRTDLRAGAVARIAGVGQRFGGLYYVTAATHTYSPRHGYRTSFCVRRNSSS